MSDEEIATHPIQTTAPIHKKARCPIVVTMAAYEVYCEIFSPQPALITGDCRGGFGAGELIAYLYARSFPKKEWRDRVNEALKGMEQL